MLYKADGLPRNASIDEVTGDIEFEKVDINLNYNIIVSDVIYRYIHKPDLFHDSPVADSDWIFEDYDNKLCKVNAESDDGTVFIKFLDGDLVYSYWVPKGCLNAI